MTDSTIDRAKKLTTEVSEKLSKLRFQLLFRLDILESGYFVLSGNGRDYLVSPSERALSVSNRKSRLGIQVTFTNAIPTHLSVP
jgi:hypothetical protein